MEIRRPTSPPPSSSPGDESAGLASPHAEPRTPPRCEVDASGRAIAISDEEWAARQAWLTQRLAEIDAEDETPDEVYKQFRRHIDEERRRVGRPPAFEGCS